MKKKNILSLFLASVMVLGAANTSYIQANTISEELIIENEEWKKGLQMEDRLHQELLKYVTVETTFEDLYFHMNHLIKEYGFINLDFLGNLGHSIVNRSEDRIYIEKGNKTKLSDVNYFTFEPHISVLNSKYGYKKENIYYFVEGKLVEL